MIEKIDRPYIAIRDYTSEDKHIVKLELNRCYTDYLCGEAKALSLLSMLEGDKRDADMMLARMR